MTSPVETENLFETFEYSERIKHLTDEINGCNSRINVFIEENHIPGYENTLNNLLEFKIQASENYHKLEVEELTLPTIEIAEKYTENLVKTWHLFHNFEKSVKSQFNRGL